jgi:hypothetical protein
MSHYWVADDLLSSRESQVTDWIEDLIEFDLDIVRGAIVEWRRKPGGHRPTPGDIHSLAFAAQQDRRERRDALEDKTAQQAGLRWESWLYELWGPASTGIEDRRQAIAAHPPRYARAEQWRAAGSKPIKHGTVPPLENFSPPASKEFVFTEQELEERRIWAAENNYASWDAYLDDVETGKASILPFYDWSMRRRGVSPLPPVPGFKTIGSALGIPTPAPRSPLASYPDDPA